MGNIFTVLCVYLFIGLMVLLIGIAGDRYYFKKWRVRSIVIIIWGLRLIYPRLYWRLLND
jgi:hypothetical protein